MLSEDPSITTTITEQTPTPTGTLYQKYNIHDSKIAILDTYMHLIIKCMSMCLFTYAEACDIWNLCTIVDTPTQFCFE